MKVAVLGNYATQFLCKPLLKGLKKMFDGVELFEAEFNSVDLEVIDNNSNLYQFNPDYIVWHESTLGVRDYFYNLNETEKNSFAEDYIQRIEKHTGIILSELPKAKIIFPTHSIPYDDNVFGNYFSKVPHSWQYQISKLNYLLAELSGKTGSLYLVNSYSPEQVAIVTDYSQVVNAELHYTPDYLTWLAQSICGLIGSWQGRFKKCIILDLDNTLWGGIIGDDGLENIEIGNLGIGKAFTRLQKWLKQLRQRGIILAVCSKNEEDIAKSPFLNHPEMVLRLEDIAVFIANWNSKADNINQIQQILNIGFDSMVFIDDNPAEREIVRKHLPEICVPELPEDPVNYLPYLIGLNLFETTSYSLNDEKRTLQYQEESKRVALAKSITNMDDYLRSLEMVGKIGPFDPLNYERIAQLTQRSNQFNLRTIRYSSEDIASIATNDQYLTVAVELKDKFGNYGLISVVIIKLAEEQTACIDTWIMSCRVLKRGVESYVLNYVLPRLDEMGILNLKGEYIPTAKNKLVSNLLPNLGFYSLTEHEYEHRIKKQHPLETYILNHDNNN